MDRHTTLVPDSARKASIDVLKTAAFTVVALSHFGGMLGRSFPQGSVSRAICDAFSRFGALGTDAFFLLSAYLLCQSMSQGSNWKTAVRRRLIRIYPGFVAMLALYLLLMPMAPHVSKVPKDPAAFLTYVAANLLLLPGIFPIEPIITVAWSLSFVVFGYALTGALYRMVQARGDRAMRRSLLWLFSTIVVGICAHQMGSQYGRIVYFPLGALLAEALPNLPYRRLAFPRVNNLAGSQWLTEFSRHSYAVLLSHGLVLHGLRWIGPATANLVDLAALLLAAGSLIVVTAIFFRAVALKPLETWIYLRERKASAATKMLRLEAAAT